MTEKSNPNLGGGLGNRPRASGPWGWGRGRHVALTGTSGQR